MVVPLIQVCIRLKVVKDWDLHPIIERSTLKDIFKRLWSGERQGHVLCFVARKPQQC